ncbi:MAG TPA: DUF2336 domain-containing protein [Pseudolabrys sp.]|nr:DUF2336 domain-containing protein [Pseudolabrys sp.]
MVKSSAYSPLDGLLDLACRDGVDIRPTLLRVLTDLYVQKPAHTADEEIQYIELAVGLIGSVDAATRAVVAARLSTYPGAPATVLRKLSSVTLGRSAEGQASKSPGLSSPDQALDRLFKNRARGNALSPQDEGNEPATAQTRIAASAISMQQTASAAAAVAAKQDLIELFFSASAEERRLIIRNLDVVAEQHARVAMPPADVIRRLESAALQRNAAEFARILEWGLGIARPIAERITSDSSGETIVIAAKAAGMNADVLQRILLFLNPVIGHSVKRVFDLARLYDEISPAAAARMLAIWRGAAVRARPVHVPQYVDDQPASARSVTAATQYARPRTRTAEAIAPRARGNGGG